MTTMTTKAACAFALAACSLNISSASAPASTTISANTDLQHPGRRKRNFAERRKLLHNNVQSSPTSLGRTSRGGFCLDDPSYSSKIGFTCKAIRQSGLNCDGFAALGFTQTETEELKISCPNACGRCTDAAAQSLSISTLLKTPAPTKAPTIAPTGAPTTTPTLLLTNSDVGTCFDDRCADDPLYIGKYNIDCGVVRSGTFDCTKFGVMNYHDDEVTELISKCPCACNIGCEVSDAPSRMSTPPPTSKPTSAAPSAHPTSRPSISPSVQPSGEPTIEPSGEPTIEPSSSFSTSMSESASLSASPSSNPTMSHSNAPSRRPVSSAPSNSPTSSPTVAPSRVPSTPSPSATPSVRHGYFSSLVPSAKLFTLINPSLSPTFSPVSKPVPSNAEDTLVSNGEAANGDMSTDFDNKVIDISARNKMIGEKEHSNAPSRRPVSSAPSNSPTFSPMALLSANPLASNATGNQTAAFLSLCLVLTSSFVAQIIFL